MGVYEDEGVEISLTDVVQAVAELAEKNQMLTEQVGDLQLAAQQGGLQLTSAGDGTVGLTAAGDEGTMQLTAGQAERDIKRLHSLQRKVCA